MEKVYYDTRLLLEIACFNLESAIIAEEAGADRIELCESYEVGGLTPSEDLIKETRTRVQIPLNVMIRPREGDFIYSEAEIETMESAILFCKKQGVDGVVFGCLTIEQKVDTRICERLMRLARPMSVTFHRAIDLCVDMKKACEDLIQMGTDRVLTSGRGANAEEGLSELKILQSLFGKKIRIMPGGGLRSFNIGLLISSRCLEYHTSALIHGLVANTEEIKIIKGILNGQDN